MSTFHMILLATTIILALMGGAAAVFMSRPCGGSREQEPDVVIEGDRRPGDGF